MKQKSTRSFFFVIVCLSVRRIHWYICIYHWVELSCSCNLWLKWCYVNNPLFPAVARQNTEVVQCVVCSIRWSRKFERRWITHIIVIIKSSSYLYRRGFQWCQDLEEILECPVCLIRPEPNVLIFQCREGHSICETCKLTVDLCPICRNTWSMTRNRLAEAFALKFEDIWVRTFIFFQYIPSFCFTVRFFFSFILSLFYSLPLSFILCIGFCFTM